MGRRTDRTGVSDTCPIIDKVISAIYSADWSETSESAELTEQMMEGIRSMNSELRDFGNQAAVDRDHFENQVDDLERKLKSLQEDYDVLHSQYTDLANEYEALQEKIIEVNQ